MKGIRVSASCISESEKAAVNAVLDRAFLGMGPEVAAFEEELSSFFSAPTVCVASGTAALQLALQALDMSPGDEVLVQTITYVASFQAISATGAIPVACGLDPSTMTINLADAEKKLSSRTKAIMPVHYAGGVGNLMEIYDFASMHNLRVVEDAAHAFGTTYQGRLVGSASDIACFSFDGIKNITSGEGGCIVTRDKDILRHCQDARLLGVAGDSARRRKGLRTWDPDVAIQGWRYHMSDIMAAIGRTQLQRFDDLKLSRQMLAAHYVNRLSVAETLTLLPHDYREVVPHIFVIRLNSSNLREKITRALNEKNIQTGRHYKPNHLLKKYYANTPNQSLSDSVEIYDQIMTLPLHPQLQLEEVDKICDIILEYL